MFQTRLENEHFNSLPNVFPYNRSRNMYSTTDRLDSSHLVDLHIYTIPKSVWRNIQHLAQNEAMDDAISAGFIRVSPDMKLYNLRQSIEKLCGIEYDFPRDFIFLRSVGRCLTRVKSTQENELKVKNYRPPQTLAPEIYLVEGRHEDYEYIPAASPALSSVSYLFGSRHQHRFHPHDYGRSSSRFSRYNHRKPLNADRNKLPTINTNNLKSHLPSIERKLTQIDSVVFDSSSLSNVSAVTNKTSRVLSKLIEEQERLRQRQAELERMRRSAEEKKIQSEREENQRQHHRVEKTPSRREEHEHRRQEKTQPVRIEDERRRQEKAQAEREEEERRRRRRQEKLDAEQQRHQKQEVAATKIQASFRGFKDRQAFRERQTNLIKNDSRISSSKTNTPIINEGKTYMNDDELSDGSEILSRSSSIGSTSDDDSNISRSDTRTIRKDNRESIHSNSSSSLKSARQIHSNLSSYSKTEETIHSSMKNNTDDEVIRTATVTKMRRSEEELTHVSTPDINDDTYELERRGAEVKRRQKIEEEKRKAKELEEQKQRELARRLQSADAESLRIHLQELRKDRVDLEKVRGEAIKRLKSIHNRITLRRKEARDTWKKKYFHEKKNTIPIEQHSTQASSDLDRIHKKIEQTIDNECKHSAQTGNSKGTEVENFILPITRTEHELHDIRRQIDQAKLRLTTDIKLRNQAENECRTLKQELKEAKMNLNHIKNRTGS